jgi:hypothetical protein
MLNAYEIVAGRYERKSHPFLGIDERLLKWFLKKYTCSVRVWIGSTWLRIGSIGGIL